MQTRVNSANTFNISILKLSKKYLFQNPNKIFCSGIDPSILTSAAFELVQASQALQAVQAVQPLLSSESPPLMTPLTQVTVELLV